MKVLNFGSLNYDYVYKVDHVITPGETMIPLVWRRISGERA